MQVLEDATSNNELLIADLAFATKQCNLGSEAEPQRQVASEAAGMPIPIRVKATAKTSHPATDDDRSKQRDFSWAPIESMRHASAEPIAGQIHADDQRPTNHPNPIDRQPHWMHCIPNQAFRSANELPDQRPVRGPLASPTQTRYAVHRDAERVIAMPSQTPLHPVDLVLSLIHISEPTRPY